MTRKKSNPKIENPVIFSVILILFLGSMALLIFGLLKEYLGSDEVQNVRSEENNDVNDETSLDEYFDEEVIYSSDDPYIRNDPFRKQCSSVSGDDTPSVSANTVCIR